MRILVCVISLAFFNVALAAKTSPDEDKAPVFEPITQDLSGRLERVERFLDNKALLDMLELLESLKTEVSSLRGEIEVQTHTVDQLKQKQRDLYTDIDRRLQRIESNKATATTAPELDTLTLTTDQTSPSMRNPRVNRVWLLKRPVSLPITGRQSKPNRQLTRKRQKPLINVRSSY